MVLINGIKYACETCIRGHRSSSCSHLQRQLFEIKRKGRPISQCDHCRELRKTKKIHVKCICVQPEREGILGLRFGFSSILQTGEC
ncbi:copper-fist-domain-containing protein [Basidiobolus meristosporus CBS 931.73]|uniref:Copper-fist-domain-containing protein n=1 Tax=Basidiobolus meristosporus CBS 931.73 TaxID=1314790 RepID=A0A1Y1XZ51_9FUNG|nr:copper-fist-domain-containing protein [Basidiobolus meristosporus CBS 931.73]|eukprot:ORX90766.1 copper-fist-domain-containing protein [Basidiobolus meristosporus CBS 931.73]